MRWVREAAKHDQACRRADKGRQLPTAHVCELRLRRVLFSLLFFYFHVISVHQSEILKSDCMRTEATHSTSTAVFAVQTKHFYQHVYQ